jgi:phytoene synthase
MSGSTWPMPGAPRMPPADRAFAAIIEEFDMPRALPEALLEGLAWDAMGRRYATLSELRGYSARVASAVGAMMCVLMRVRDAHALARACDLGVAMQLTNIARDVGEDAARGGFTCRPTGWTRAWPRPRGVSGRSARPELAAMSKRLLAEAERLYIRSEAGVGLLPLSCRTRHLCRALHLCRDRRARCAAGARHITTRAHTGKAQKLAG